MSLLLGIMELLLKMPKRLTKSEMIGAFQVLTKWGHFTKWGYETKNIQCLVSFFGCADFAAKYVDVLIIGEDQIVVEDAETFDKARDDWRFSSPHQMGTLGI